MRAGRAILIGSLGNLVEWFDFYAFSAFSLYFAHSFFPGEDPVMQMLSAAGVFALGFFMRPIGAWIFGYVGDRHGRRKALTLSVLFDVRRFPGNRRDADLCVDPHGRARAVTHGTIATGPQSWRRIRIKRRLSLGDGASKTSRLLFELSICADHRRPIDRTHRSAHPAKFSTVLRAIARLGLAHPFFLWCWPWRFSC